MRTTSKLLVALFAITSAAVIASTSSAAGQATDTAAHAQPEAVIAELDWLAGNWSGDMWGGRFEAFYSTPEGGRVLSHSRLMKDGAVVFYEFEVFEGRDELVHLQPYPGGKPAGGFTLASHDPATRTAVFENPEKDFPTRITYQRVSDDKLVIDLTDPHGGSDKVERFELSR